MQHYIGSKIIQAEPLTRGEYNERRGWIIPVGENPEDAGFYLQYPDGYISWSPAEVFNDAYLPLGEIGHKPAHQQRVIGEREQVNDRLIKLTAFLYTDTFNELPDDERSLMYAQQAAMQDYVGVLDERIALFQDTPQG